MIRCKRTQYRLYPPYRFIRIDIRFQTNKQYIRSLRIIEKQSRRRLKCIKIIEHEIFHNTNYLPFVIRRLADLSSYTAFPSHSFCQSLIDKDSCPSLIIFLSRIDIRSVKQFYPDSIYQTFRHKIKRNIGIIFRIFSIPIPGIGTHTRFQNRTG